MAGVSQVKIIESIEQLKTLLSEQKTSDNFQKIQVLYLLKSQQVKTITEVASIIGKHRVTIQYWLRCYQQEGIEELLQEKKGGGRKPFISPQIIDKLRDKLDKNTDFQSYKEIQNWLNKEFQLGVSYDVVYYLVKKKLKYSPKK
ncbi:helix-turn-helix domain-containing protein [Geminocystis herdmanii]|uniref:helix-turn-helix domain-containing protein n=1 Tax=Geminocystis herdmanii TaxID=669359 RepID=UPI000347B23B|nr:helix-turn-helix domain-containing protein [Geminocystis herdmanii]